MEGAGRGTSPQSGGTSPVPGGTSPDAAKLLQINWISIQSQAGLSSCTLEGATSEVGSVGSWVTAGGPVLIPVDKVIGWHVGNQLTR